SPSETSLLHQIGASVNELQELLRWWRARQRFVEHAADPAWDTELHTFHVAKPYIDLIRRQAEFECTTITEIVNRAFQQFFAGSEPAADCHGEPWRASGRRPQSQQRGMHSSAGAARGASAILQNSCMTSTATMPNQEDVCRPPSSPGPPATDGPYPGGVSRHRGCAASERS